MAAIFQDLLNQQLLLVIGDGGILLLFVIVLYWILHMGFHQLLDFPEPSYVFSPILLLVRGIGFSYAVLLAGLHLHNTSTLPGSLIYLGSAAFLLLFTISTIMPLRHEWSYTRDGALLGRAKFDVFLPPATLLLYLIFLINPDIASETLRQGLMGLINSSKQYIATLLGSITESDPQNTKIIAFGVLYIIILLLLVYSFFRGLHYMRDYGGAIREVVTRRTLRKPEYTTQVAIDDDTALWFRKKNPEQFEEDINRVLQGYIYEQERKQNKEGE
ncbi:hypothetical protein GF373_11920 [bacterium]|nr:hypothetical protein [bacterium]